MSAGIQEKNTSYLHTNTYVTLNELTDETTHIWLVFHGMGYLSKYFIHYFNGLDPQKHYVISPQAPSKYYQDSSFKRIGASWLTRENTKQETTNIMNYIDAIYETEIKNSNKKLVLMGYSQGVSIVTRWLAHSKVDCSHLVLHSGGIPTELVASDFEFLNADTAIRLVYGTTDPYINEERLNEQKEMANRLFKHNLEILPFEGAHVVNEAFINHLI